MVTCLVLILGRWSLINSHLNNITNFTRWGESSIATPEEALTCAKAKQADTELCYHSTIKQSNLIAHSSIELRNRLLVISINLAPNYLV